LDADLGREDALQGYILQESARDALESLASQLLNTQQRAFTWTGPYGGGKSSLALALGSMVHSDTKIRKKARETLGFSADSPVSKAFAPGREGWIVLPLVGYRGSIRAAIVEAIKPHIPKRRGVGGAGDVVRELVALAESTSHAGVLVVLDELGSFSNMLR
jgi:hypothetical protein